MAMKTLSETIGTHAGGMEFHAADGRKHKVKPLTLALLGQFEKWLEGRALKSIMGQKELLGEDFSTALSVVSGDIVAGKYAFGGASCATALQSVPGSICLISLMLGVDEIRASHLISTQAEEIKVIMEAMVAESMPEGKPVSAEAVE